MFAISPILGTTINKYAIYIYMIVIRTIYLENQT